MTVEKYKRENPASVQAQEPSLPEMTTKALELLQKGNKKGFYLQVEGALIDKRSHANDAAQALEETKAFDEAVKIAYDFARRDGHTLVIVTADHETRRLQHHREGHLHQRRGHVAAGQRRRGQPGEQLDAVASRRWDQGPGPLAAGIINGAGSGDPKNFGPATFRTAGRPAPVSWTARRTRTSG